MKKINIDGWKKFRIDDLFNMNLSKDDIQPKLINEGPFPVVSSGKENNGICAYVEKQNAKLWNAGVLTVDMFGKTFYQEKPFYCVSHGRVNILVPKNNVSEMALRFIGVVIEKVAMEKYGFQEMCTGTKLAKELILLPADSNDSPDWQFMEDYIKEIQKKVQNKVFKQKGIKKKIDIATENNKTGEEWKKYRIGDLFKVSLSKDDIQPKLTNEGPYPLVSSGKENNGICAYIEKQNAKLWDAGVLTVDMFGKAFYQEKPFYCVSHGRVNILTPQKDISEMALRFIGAVIEKTTIEKYNFQEMCTGTKLVEESIFLPTVGDNGEPDWEGIENFMHSIADNVK